MFFIISALLPLVIVYCIFCLKVVEKISFVKIISPDKLTEGDWVMEDIFYGGKKIYSCKSPGVTKKQILLIKRVGEKVKIKEGIPFVPSIFISVVVSLIFGNLIMFIV